MCPVSFNYFIVRNQENKSQKMEGRFDGKTFVVTGAGQGAIFFLINFFRKNRRSSILYMQNKLTSHSMTLLITLYHDSAEP